MAVPTVSSRVNTGDELRAARHLRHDAARLLPSPCSTASRYTLQGVSPSAVSRGSRFSYPLAGLVCGRHPDGSVEMATAR
jgi:hypothetical protein